MSYKDQVFLRVLTAVYTYYEKELTEFLIALWAEDLEGYDMEAIEQAFNRHRRDPEAGKWLPKTADILKQLHGDANETALIEWGAVLACVRAGGSGLGQLSDAARAAVRDMGGTSVLGRADEAQNGFLQRRFLDTYKAHAKREANPPLIGAEVLKLIGGSTKRMKTP